MFNKYIKTGDGLIQLGNRVVILNLWKRGDYSEFFPFPSIKFTRFGHIAFVVSFLNIQVVLRLTKEEE